MARVFVNRRMGSAEEVTVRSPIRTLPSHFGRAEIMRYLMKDSVRRDVHDCEKGSARILGSARRLASPTVVPSHESISVISPHLPLNVLLGLLQSDVHVAVD